mmetsp:Transcript_22485/g.48027  ORF Transcript_22485/g.48027 Transcript_22485/m.48027 type:complete len:207 (-) Transcript_22485:43-663(-)
MAISGDEAFVDNAYVEPTGPPGEGGPCRILKDWRDSCRPSLELYEKSLGAIVRAYKENGAKVAIATVPLLGDDLTEDIPPNPKTLLARSPYLTVKELGEAARRVAKEEGCWVLPLKECMEHHVRGLGLKGPNRWTPLSFGMKMKSLPMMMGQEMTKQKSEKYLPWEDLGPKASRPVFCHDLVHFNESAGALHAALVQTWLEARLAD